MCVLYLDGCGVAGCNHICRHLGGLGELFIGATGSLQNAVCLAVLLTGHVGGASVRAAVASSCTVVTILHIPVPGYIP